MEVGGHVDSVSGRQARRSPTHTLKPPPPPPPASAVFALVFPSVRCTAQASFGDGDTVTVDAVAAAAFASGWFCALLLMITIACWAEVSSAAGGGGGRVGEEAWWRASVASWLVRVFTAA